MKQLRFKHKTGSRKHIPGVKPIDLEPRMLSVSRHIPQINKSVSVFERDPSHVVKVNLADADPDKVALTEVEEKLPKTVQDRILERRADEFENLSRYNEDFIARIRQMELNGEIHEVEIVDADLEDAIGATNLDISEIAYADYIDRNVPIPDGILKANADKIAVWEEARKKGTVPAAAVRTIVPKPAKAAKEAAPAADPAATGEGDK